MDDFEEYLEKQLKNPEFRKEWERLEQEYQGAREQIMSKQNTKPSRRDS